ncbi:zuotin related factor-1 like with a DNAJ domain at the N-terminus and 2 SANT domains [Cryptosporidium sp. chipmunk genotype I]|uniref:zuotin related factor-1 like with a DNAJ domain at the N-terminus and 2 SANT domains n=1 Tax=Cryptosporidium sp. chipmunk genotype I TaxID=1280935 RepID=UPI003519ED92|nr:zuotin related factor-1 like with a DNAJ domain at the N-terminus and 2 SANT domains [Cryptosporidium sp. chipmunk genotype I]
MGKSTLFALPPIPAGLYEELISGPVIQSSVAEFAFKKKIEPVGEAFFYRYEGRELNKIDSLKEDIKIEDPTINNIYSQDEGKKKSKKIFRNKSGNKLAKGVLSLARLKELVEEKETLYEKLGLDENVGIKEIKQAYRKLALSYHPDKNKENSSDARSEEFLKIQEAYEILSDKNLRHTYDSALPFDDTIPSIYVNENNDFHKFKNFFSPIFHRNSRWSIIKPVPDIGNADDKIEVVENFYEFWRGFQSNRDFSIYEEHELNHAECREEKRWMERQNSKIRSKYIRNEISRINKLVDLAYKNDPRIKEHFENFNKRKEEEIRKKLEEKKIAEEKKRLMDENFKKKAIELKSAIKSLRVSIRNKMKNISDLNVFFGKFQEEDFSGYLKVIENFNWIGDFLKNMHLNEVSQIYSIEKISFKQWEEWFLKLDHFQLKQLDNFLDKWTEVFGKNCNDDYLKKLYFIFSIKILGINYLNSDKSLKPINKTDQSNMVNFSSKCLSTYNENSSSEWTVSEMSLLAKALQKYPGGYKNRWDIISEYLKNTKTKEQILTKVKELSESEKLAKLSNEVKEKSAFDTFIQSNKGVLKKFDSTPDVRDYVGTSVINNSANANVVHPNKGTDFWTKDQQCSLEKALKQYPSSLPPSERWELISSCIPGKDSSQCFARYKLIRERILKKQK